MQVRPGTIILAEQNLTLRGMVAVEVATPLYVKEIRTTERIVEGFPGAHFTRWRKGRWRCRGRGWNLKVGQASETPTDGSYGFTRDH